MRNGFGITVASGGSSFPGLPVRRAVDEPRPRSSIFEINVSPSSLPRWTSSRTTSTTPSSSARAAASSVPASMTVCPSSSRLTRHRSRSEGSSSTTRTVLVSPLTRPSLATARNPALCGDFATAVVTEIDRFTFIALKWDLAPDLSSWTPCSDGSAHGSRNPLPAFAAARGCSSSARSTPSARLGPYGPGRPDQFERRLPSEQLDALEEPRRDPGAGDGDANRLKRFAGLERKALGERSELPLDRRRLEPLRARGHGLRRGQHVGPAVQQRRVGPDVLEEEPRVVGELAERRDLLLDERRGFADQLLVPVDSLLPEVGDDPVGVLLRRKHPQMHAVQPLELLVVEDGGTR